jgi:hypothetical protein
LSIIIISSGNVSALQTPHRGLPTDLQQEHYRMADISLRSVQTSLKEQRDSNRTFCLSEYSWKTACDIGITIDIPKSIAEEITSQQKKTSGSKV